MPLTTGAGARCDIAALGEMGESGPTGSSSTGPTTSARIPSWSTPAAGAMTFACPTVSRGLQVGLAATSGVVRARAHGDRLGPSTAIASLVSLVPQLFQLATPHRQGYPVEAAHRPEARPSTPACRQPGCCLSSCIRRAVRKKKQRLVFIRKPAWNGRKFDALCRRRLLRWRSGMTVPAIRTLLGPFLSPNEKPGFLAGRSANIPKVMKREDLRSD
jgi:hypothetical protein